jgi:hypothetical protein
MTPGARWGVRRSWIIFVAIGLLGLALIGVAHSSQSWGISRTRLAVLRVVVEAAGHSFLVAAILALTVDWFAKAHLLREAARDFAPYLFGWRLPDAVVARIRETFSTDLIGYERRYDYRLEEQSATELQVHVTLSFTLENHSNSVRDHTEELSVWALDEPTFESLGIICGTETRSRFNIEEVFGFRKAKARAPISIPAKGKASVTWQYSFRTHRNHSEINSWPFPVIGVTIRALCPPGIEFVSDPDPSLIRTGATWFYKDRLYWTGEYIRVRWFTRT